MQTLARNGPERFGASVRHFSGLLRAGPPDPTPRGIEQGVALQRSATCPGEPPGSHDRSNASVVATLVLSDLTSRWRRTLSGTYAQNWNLETSCRPLPTQKLGLLQHRLGRLLLLVRRVAVLAEERFDDGPHLGPGGLLDGPVDGHVRADGVDQLVGDVRRVSSPSTLTALSLTSRAS